MLHALPPVDVLDLPHYPIGPDQRLDSHGYVQWEYRRWLASDMRWNGSHECKSMWFELVNLAHGETPVGTLPDDPKRLARMIQPAVERDRFEELCKLDYGPLHGWVRCRCEDDVRLMHPVVTRVVLSAMASRANAAARVEAASQARRLKRLTEELMQVAPNLAGDPAKVRFVDGAIQDRIAQRGGERRTGGDLDAAIQDCIAKMRAGGFSGSG